MQAVWPGRRIKSMAQCWVGAHKREGKSLFDATAGHPYVTASEVQTSRARRRKKGRGNGYYSTDKVEARREKQSPRSVGRPGPGPGPGPGTGPGTAHSVPFGQGSDSAYLVPLLVLVQRECQLVCVDTAPADNLFQMQQLVIGPAIIGQSAADAVLPGWSPSRAHFFLLSPPCSFTAPPRGLLSPVHHTWLLLQSADAGQG